MKNILPGMVGGLVVVLVGAALGFKQPSDTDTSAREAARRAIDRSDQTRRSDAASNAALEGLMTQAVAAKESLPTPIAIAVPAGGFALIIDAGGSVHRIKESGFAELVPATGFGSVMKYLWVRQPIISPKLIMDAASEDIKASGSK